MKDISTNTLAKIDTYLAKLPEWQRVNLRNFRSLIHKAAPNVQEDWKWNVPVFIIDNKMVFAMSAFKAHTKYNFIKNGALLENSNNLFNNGFDSKTARAIDLKEGENIDQEALLELIQQSIDKL